MTDEQLQDKLRRLELHNKYFPEEYISPWAVIYVHEMSKHLEPIDTDESLDTDCWDTSPKKKGKKKQ